MFGSRARGDFSEYSDYDILIVTKEKINKKEKNEMENEIRREVAKKLFVAIDTVFIDKESFEKYKDVKGCLIRIVNKEGIVI